MGEADTREPMACRARLQHSRVAATDPTLDLYPTGGGNLHELQVPPLPSLGRRKPGALLAETRQARRHGPALLWCTADQPQHRTHGDG